MDKFGEILVCGMFICFLLSMASCTVKNVREAVGDQCQQTARG